MPMKMRMVVPSHSARGRWKCMRNLAHWLKGLGLPCSIAAWFRKSWYSDSLSGTWSSGIGWRLVLSSDCRFINWREGVGGCGIEGN